MDAEKLVKVVSEAMAYMYTSASKKPIAERKPSGSRPFLGTPRPLELTQGINGSLDPSLKCGYCKDNQIY